MDDGERVARILADWCEKRDHDEGVTTEELLREHPDLAESLRGGLAAMDLVDRLFQDVDGPPPAGVPEVIGGYRILKKLGQGGMGVVYEAVQLKMNRRVALKLLAPGITGVGQAVKRFQREAQAAGTLHHTNIVPIYEMDQEGGYWFYAMELVRGRSLAEVIVEARERRGDAARDDPEVGSAAAPGSMTDTGARGYYLRVAEMFAGVAEALAIAHEEGVIHRDIKPANLLLDSDGTLKIVDFGLAHLENQQMSMTRTGQMLGTPVYMSPEQAMAKRMGIDHRTDVYSLGATLYELLALRPPFRAETLQELCSQIVTKDPDRPRRENPRVPRDLETICLKAMSKDRDERYQTADEFAHDLRAFAEGGQIRARRIGIAGRTWRRVKRHRLRSALVAALLVLAAVATVLGIRASEEAAGRRDLRYSMLLADGYAALTHETRESPLPTAGPNAADIFTAAIELDPDRPDAYAARALARLHGTGSEEVTADIERARRLGISDRTCFLLDALNATLGGRAEEAEAFEIRARALPAGTAFDDFVEGRILLEQARREEALSALDRALLGFPEGDPMQFVVRRVRATVELDLGRVEAALGDLLSVHAAGDRNVVTRSLLAYAWQLQGRVERAAQIRKELLGEARRAGTARALVYVGDYLQADPHLALAAAEEATQIDPDDFAAHWLRGLVHELPPADPGQALEAFDQAIRLSPEDGPPASLRLARAEALSRLHRHEEALAECRAVLRESGESAEARSQVSKTLLGLGRPRESLAAADRAVEIDPRYDRAHGLRALSLLLLGRHEEAVAAAGRAVDLAPLDPRCHRIRSVVLRSAGRPEEALGEARRAVELPHECALCPTELGLVLLDLDRSQEALACFERALGPDPDAATALEGVGRALLDLGRPEEAEAAFARAEEHHPNPLQIAIRRGVVAEARGRNEEALAHLDRARRLLADEPAPSSKAEGRADTLLFSLHANRGIVLAHLHRFQEAVEELGLALEITDDVRARAMRAGARMSLGDTENALADAERAIELDPAFCLTPEGFNVHKVRCAALLRLHGAEAGLTAIEALLESELDPKDRAHLLIEAGVTLAADSGKIEEALDRLERGIRLDPDNARGLFCRGVVLLRLERIGEAISSFGAAARLAGEGPLRDQSLEHLVRIESYLNRTGEAESALRAVDLLIEFHPRDPNLQAVRSNLLLRLGRRAEALAAADLAIEIDPESLLARSNRAQALLHDRPAETLEEIDRVLATEPHDAFARGIRATALGYLGRYAEALEIYDTLLSENPGDSMNRYNRAFLLSALQREEEALREYRAAGPGFPGDGWIAGAMYSLAELGRFEEALQMAGLAKRDPRAVLGPLVFCLRALGRDEQALDLARRHGDSPDSSDAYLCAVAGKEELARRLAEEDRGFPVLVALNRAGVYSVLHDRKLALEWLRRAIEAGYRPDRSRAIHEFAWLSGDPEYEALVRSGKGDSTPK